MSNMKKITQLLALSSFIYGSIAANVNIALASHISTNRYPVKLAQSSRQQPSRARQIVEDNDLKFQLRGCQRRAKKVSCYLYITNVANQDRQVSLHANFNGLRSRIIDVFGDEYISNLAQIGTSQDYSSAVATLIRGIPLKASVTFEVPEQVTKLAVLEVRYFIYDLSKHSKVEFRNVGIISSQ